MARDAAEIEPKFVPDDNLVARDNSGGRDYKPRRGEWDDGGDVVGSKSHLSAGGGGSKRGKRDDY